LNESFKSVIDMVVNSPVNYFANGEYRFGKKKPMKRVAAMLYLVETMHIPDEYAMDAIQYLDDSSEAKNKQMQNEAPDESDRPTIDTYKDGDIFPEYLEPIDMAMLLFTGFEVATSRTLKFSRKLGVPQWMIRVNPSLTVSDRVKEHDVRAGVGAEIRRYKRFRSEAEKKSGHTFTVDEVMVCRESVTSTIRAETLDNIVEELKFDPEMEEDGQAEIARFLKLYNTPKESEHTKQVRKLHRAMISHWIWQVKRRINKKPTVFEIALVFLGRQGIGKSFSTRKMTEVVSDLSTPASVSNLVDERETRRWENYYIAFLDEISKETKDSLAKLKDWVTKTESEFRPLYMNSSEGCDKNAQAIGTSNFPLATILKDPSGMRRFWEIPSDQEKSRIFKGMEDIDWELIYKSIDENEDLGYYGPHSKRPKLYDEVVAIQNAARDKSPVEEYLFNEDYVDINGSIDTGTETKWFTLKELREDFDLWTEQNGWGQYTPKAFRLELQNMHLDVRKGSGNALVVELNVPEKLKDLNNADVEEIGFEK